MKIRTLAVAGIAAISIGCGVDVYGPGGCGENDRSVVIIDRPYVNTWLSIPSAVEELIAPSVDGYFSPRLSRYCEYLYPTDIPYNSNDLPCYVKSDFNGDGYSDYAFLFSRQEWEHHEWYLTTKMVVVLSTRDGWVLGADMILGTVHADESVPIEEYWSIFKVSAGSHTFTTSMNGVTVTKTIALYNDGFYLASLDPVEEAIFYADGWDVYETSPSGALAKKTALSKTGGSANRIIPFNKKVEGRVRAIK
jgi:hypothetical protein